MSAFGTKRTSRSAQSLSALGGKAAIKRPRPLPCRVAGEWPRRTRCRDHNVGTTDASSGRQSDLLLQDVKVIAIDQIASQRKNNLVFPKVLTLEVTPVQAQKILLATDVGSLSLILWKAGDANIVANSRVTEVDLSNAPRPMPPCKNRVATTSAPLRCNRDNH